MTIHHAIDDGWGNVVFLDQLLNLYSALKRGDSAPVLRSANVYKEFIALEREAAMSGYAAEHWRGIKLPRTQRAPLQQTFSSPLPSATGRCFAIAGEIVNRVREICSLSEVSLKAFFLTAYFRLLQCETGQQRNTVGVVVNGRSARLSEPFQSLGLFWNIIPLAEQQARDVFLADMKHVHSLLTEGEPFATYPLQKLLQDRKGADLFFATFNFIHFHHSVSLFRAEGVKILGSRTHDKFHYPLNFAVAISPVNQAGSLLIEYDALFFKGVDIDRIGERYLGFLARAAWDITTTSGAAIPSRSPREDSLLKRT